MTGISTLGQALAQIGRIRDQQILIDTFSTQLATGKKTQKFSGLGQDVITSKRARADIQSLENYINNIKNADRRIQQTLDAIEAFKQQAENFQALLVGFSQQGVPQKGETVYYDDPLTTSVVEAIPIGLDSSEPSVELETLAEFANNVFNTFVDLLNIQEGDRYLMSGAETRTKPLADTSALDAAMSSLLGDWKNGTITTDQFMADLNDRTTSGGNTDALTDTIVGFSAVLSAGNVKSVYARVDEKTEVDYTALATDDAFRNILVAAAYFKNENLGPVVDEVDPNTLAVITEGAPGANIDEATDNFFAIFNNFVASINEAIDDIDQVRFKLENARVRLDSFKTAHTNQINVLNDVVSEVEDADINEVAISLNALSFQLEASYGVTARVQALSLVNFIT
ncbi:MAG: flagellin [Alphaproteobacteria bacterium]|nr:flagellin [Alphaproteobacteria bacterium]